MDFGIRAWLHNEGLTSKEMFHTSNGNEVYGSGGIYPDYVVRDTPELAVDILSLYHDDENFFYQFALQYISEKKLKVVPKLLSHNDLQSFGAVAESHGKQIRLSGNKKDILFLIRRDIAYLLNGEEGRFRVNYSRDSWLQEAGNRVIQSKRSIR